MAEPETQSEDETVTSEFLEQAKTETTDTDVTEDATVESGQVSSKYKSTDYESETNEDIRKRPWMDKRWARGMKS